MSVEERVPCAVLDTGAGRYLIDNEAVAIERVQNNSSGDGLQRTDQAVQVFIGGQQAADVPYSGLAPGYTGLYQVDARVPDTV